MSGQHDDLRFPCAADALPPAEIAALKELDRHTRDQEATEVLQGVQRRTVILGTALLIPWIRFWNRFWECRLGINTRGYTETQVPEARHYVTMPYLSVLAMLQRLSLASADVFVDIGCGKGRVVCCAARFTVREVIGIDVNKELCERAHHNAARLRGKRAPITIIPAAAQDFDYRRGTVFLLFNPFGADTLTRVIAKLRLALDAEPRPVRIVYLNPLHESVLSNSGWLEMYDRWEPRNTIGLKHYVSFWRSQTLKGGQA